MRAAAVLTGILVASGCTVEGPVDDVEDCRKGRAECPAPAGTPFPDPLTHVARANGPTFFETTDVVVDGDLVYACSGVRGLTIWDASATPPRELSTEVAPAEVSHSGFPRCQHISLDRNNARVAITNRGDEIQPAPWVWIYDVSDPQRPAPIAGWTPGDVSVEGVVLDGDRVFVAGHGSGVIELRLEGDALTEVTRTVDANSDAWQPILLGETLIVAEGATGLRTYDTQNGLMLQGALAVEGSSRDVVLAADTAYVAASSHIAAVNLADPATPTLLGSTPTTGTALGLALMGDAEVVVAEWDELRAYDFADPSNVQRLFSEIVPTDDLFSRVLAVDAASDGGSVFAGEWRGVHRFDRGSAEASPDISVSPQSLQLGNIGPEHPGVGIAVVRNEGSARLTVNDVVSRPGVTARPDCFSLEPGEEIAIEVHVEQDGAEEVRTRLEFCSDDPDEPHHAISMTANIPGIGVGDEVPDFSLLALDGSTVSNRDLRGSVVVLAYFATF